VSEPDSLVSVLRRRAARSAEKEAYLFLPDGETEGERLTYGELDRRARAIGGLLQSLGSPGDRALLLLPSGSGFIAAFYGCLYGSVIAVPAYPPRRNKIDARLLAICRDARPRFVLTTGALLSRLSGDAAGLPGLEGVRWLAVDALAEDQATDQAAAAWEPPAVSREDLAFLQYTSGSTAAPKGVMVSHGNLLANAEVMKLGLEQTEESVFASWLPLFHDMGLIGVLLQAVHVGGRCILMPPMAFLQRPFRWLQALSRYRATFTSAPNFAYELCAARISEEQRRTLDLSSVATFCNGAEPVRGDTVERFTALFAACGLRPTALNPCYGLAEATLCATSGGNAEAPRTGAFDAAALAAGSAVLADAGSVAPSRTMVGCGRPWLEQRLVIADPETGSLCPPGRIGEIWVAGLSIAQGYWNRPELSRETFQARLAESGDGPFLRTGDLGFLHGGELFVAGRIKDLLILRGRNHYPQDLELTMERSHPALRPGCGVAFSIEVDGEKRGEERLVLAQELEPRRSPDLDLPAVAETIRRAVAAEHDAEVYAVALLAAGSVAKTTSGKLQRQACRTGYLEGSLEILCRRTWEPLPEPLPETVPEAAEREPAGELPSQAAVAAWLARRLPALLGVPAGEIDPREPLAAYGLGSLHAATLAGDLARWLGRPLPPTLVYDFPTLESLAAHLAGAGSAVPAGRETREASPEGSPGPGPVAIIGIGCRFPGAPGRDEFWKLLRDGVDAITKVPRERWDADAFYAPDLASPGKMTSRHGGFLTGVDLLDAPFFGLSPREAEHMDPQQRLLLETAWEALEDAGLAPEPLQGTRTSVFIGISSNDYARGHLTESSADAHSGTGNALSIAANRLSYFFDFRGPSAAVDTACSSALVAVHLACQSLASGAATLAVAGGVNLIFSPATTIIFSKAGLLAADGRCKAFDARADGYVRGEGAGVVILKPLARAVADGDRIYAVILGGAVNQDGRSNGLTAPNRQAQEAVLREACLQAGVSPAEVDYVEAHGSGTALGDAIEGNALASVLAAGRSMDRPCRFGSVKSNIGHLEAAAGIAGLIKVALSLHHRELPPTLHVEEPNPRIPFDRVPLRLQLAAEPWPTGSGPARAGVSAFGFGGTNVHLVLEEGPVSPASGPSRPWQLLPLSARTTTALETATANLAVHLRRKPDTSLVDAAWTLAVGRRAFPHRRVVLSRNDAVEAAGFLESLDAGRVLSHVRAPGAPSVAFLCGGLGDQYPDLGLGLYQGEPVFRAMVDRCAEILRPRLGADLREVLYPRGVSALELAGEEGEGTDLRRLLRRAGAAVDPAGPLSRTRLAHPALFAAEYALATLWMHWGVRPQALLGHSLGEYVAACLAGVLSLEDALILVAERARLLDELAAGALLTVPLAEAEARALLGGDLWLAVVNGPASCVVAGGVAAVERLERTLAERGVPVSRPLAGHAFHSPLLAPAAEPLTALARSLRLQPPGIPCLSNVTGDWLTAEQATDPAYWARHMVETVRFGDGLAKLLADPARLLLEIGPGQSLGSFARQNPACGAGRLVFPSLRHAAHREPDQPFLLRTLGKLWLAGVEIDWPGFHGGEQRRRVSLPSYPWERRRYWLDAAESRPAAEPGPELRGEPAGWFLRPRWRRTPRPDAPAGGGRLHWLILIDAHGVGEALAQRLRAAGGAVVTAAPGERFLAAAADAYTVRPGSGDDFGWLLDDLERRGRMPERIVHLWSLTAEDERPLAERLPEGLERGAHTLLALARALERKSSRPAVHLAVAGTGLAALVAGDRIDPEKAPLLGFCRVVPQELSGVTCRAVDLPFLAAGSDPATDPAVDPAAWAETLLAELSGGGGEPLVAWRGEERRALVFEPVRREEAGEPRLRRGGVYLITGGLGGVGRILADFLFRRHGARLVLVGRSPLPPRETWDELRRHRDTGDSENTELLRRLAFLETLEEQGAAVLVETADVADAAALRLVIARCEERFGALHGVIHAAGLVAAGSFVPLRQLDRDGCAAHFRSKIDGTVALAAALRGRKLDFCLLAGSISTVLGGPRLAAYAAGNAFLDAFAEERFRRGEPWLTVDWDGWRTPARDEVSGLGASLAEHQMSPAEGGEAFALALAFPAAGRLVVSIGDLDARMEPRRGTPQDERPAAPREAAGRTLYARPGLQAAFVPAGNELERGIAAVWQRVLGVEQVGVDDNFFDLGGNSLVGGQVLAELRRDLGLQISSVTLFEAPTVSSLARVLGERLGTPREPGERRPAPAVVAPVQATGEREVAIIGMAGRFPGADSVEELWANLCAGTEGVSFFSAEELREAGVDPAELSAPSYVRARPVLRDADRFDARLFGYSPREATLMDPQQRVFLECCWHALENAGYDPRQAGVPIGLFAGASFSSYLLRLYGDPAIRPTLDLFQMMVGNDKDSLPTTASYKLDLKGPSLAVQSHCSTSLVAVHLACGSLLAGECGIALAGGVSVRAPQKTGYSYQPGGQESADGHTRPFDARATGTVFGDGVGIVVLKRLRDALADGDTIHAVIRGSAINNDGSLKAGYTAPSIEGQSLAVTAALARAGVDASTLGYVEAHGSATPLGDPIEVAALSRAFRATTPERAFCALGSVKGNVGHLDRASGVTGLLKATLAVREGIIPPTLFFTEPNPELDLPRSPFWVPARLTPWTEAGRPRRAGVNSLGMGGTNAHVVLEQAPERAPSGPSRPWQLLVLSAHTAPALETATAQLVHHLRARLPAAAAFADTAFTLQVGRRAGEHRRAVLCQGAEEAAAALESLDPRRVLTHTQKRADRPVAFLFPGVGDHYPGMAGGLYRHEPVFRRQVDLCAEILRPHLGLDLREILYPGGGEEEKDEPLDLRRMLGERPEASALDRTLWAQPAVFVVEIALARLWMEWGLRPDSLLGYSLGEYTAACLAGVFSLEDALRLVAVRARLIEALPVGAMLAVPLSEAAVLPHLTAHPGPALALAAVNAPALCTVAGPVAAVEELERRLAGQGTACRRLPATHAFHSPMMEPAVTAFRAALATVRLQPPQIPCVSNVTGTWLTPEQATDAGYWVRHLLGTVRFAEGVGTLLAEPERVLLETGPGQSLSSFVKQHGGCDAERGQRVLASLRSSFERRPDQATLLGALGRLWIAGVRIDWPAFWAGERRGRIPLPGYPFERQRYWLEAQLAASLPAAPDPLTGAVKEPDLADWLYLPVWRQVPLPDPGPAASWLIFADAGRVGAEVAARLEKSGHQVTLASDPGGRSGYDALLRELRDSGALPQRIAHFGSLDAPAGDLRAALDRGFHSLLLLAQALADLGSPPVRIAVVTSGVHAVTGAETLVPERATVLGLCRVLPQEHPTLACRQIDLALEGGGERERTLDGLARELAAETEETMETIVALRGGRRWTQAFEAVRLAAGTGLPRLRRLREAGVYLITGGLGGLGLGMARFLAAAWRARLVLVGRSPLPPRETWDAVLAGPDGGETSRRIRRVRELEELGSDVLLLTADVADVEQMRAAVTAAVARFGRIDGTLHTAGVPGAGLIQLKTAAAAEQVLAPKVQGTLALAEALRPYPPGFLVLFSSITSITGGGPGQVDYCAANAFLDAFAHSRSTPERPVISIDWSEWQWDAWQEGLLGFAPEIRELFRENRRRLGITFEEGAEVLTRLLSRDLAQAVVSSSSLSGLLALTQALSRPGFAAAPGGERPAAGVHPRPLLGTPWVAPATPTETALAVIWSEILGLEAVGVHDDFFELGGHSLLATQLFSRVRSSLAVELPLRAVFEAPTIAGLAARIDGETRGGRPAVVVAAVVRRPWSGGEVPLSFAQQRLWFLDRLEPGNPFYNVSGAVRLMGALDLPALARSLGEIVRRHEVLRTVLDDAEGRPVGRLLPADRSPADRSPSDQSPALPLVDLRALPPARRELAGMGLGLAHHRLPFSLARGPLLRLLAVRLDAEEHLFFLTVHHSASDEWSMGVLLLEVAALYQSFHAGRPSPLPELPIQYADFAAWQREWLRGEVLASSLGWWTERLAGELPVLQLPADRPRPAVRSFRGAACFAALPGLGGPLRDLSQQHGATLFMTLLAGFAALLFRLTGQSDLVLGTPIANRTRQETEGLLGFFVNTLALRTDLSGDPSFAVLLERVREVTLGAFAHQDLPFDRLVEALRPERSLGHSPLFQVLFTLQSSPMPGWSLGDLEMRPLPMDTGTAKFDLELVVDEREESLPLLLEYSTGLFDAATIDRLVGHYQVLLAGIASGAERRLSDLPLLTAAELAQLAAWNETACDLPDACAHQLFAARAGLHPEDVAVTCGERSLSYGELNRQADGWAGELVRRGVGPDGVVALLADRGIELLVAILAVFKAGGAYLPLDPEHPASRLRSVVELAGARLVLCGESYVDLAGTLTAPAALSFAALETAGSAAPPRAQATPDNLAYVIFTSGSTGTPKGAMVEHRGMLNHLLAKIADLGLSATDTVAQNASQCFDISVWQLLAPLLSGGRVHIVEDAAAHDPRGLLAEVERGGVTVLETVPSLLRVLLDEALLPGGADRLARLRWLIPTGEALPPRLCRDWLAAFPGVPLLNAYGPTECSDDVAHHPLRTPPAGSAGYVPIGRPVGNLRLHVVDVAERAAAVGVPGELWVAGAGVGRGYRNDPARTAAAFTPDPWSARPGERLYRTGDLVRRRIGGEIEFLGRIDHQVKLRGFRIELGEIEAALVGHPVVAAGAVLLRGDLPGGPRLVAYVAGLIAEMPSADELRAWLGDRLPDPMIPAVFVSLEALPLTPNGKVDRRALARLPVDAGGLETARVPPRTATEQALALLWAELLEIEGGRIGAGDGFFALGGHSLLATRLVSRLRSDLGVELPLRAVFEAPVLSALAERLDATAAGIPTSTAMPPLRPVPRDRPLELSHAQQRLWFLSKLEPDSPLYDSFTRLRLSGDLDVAVLVRALTALRSRHETLRTTFPLVDGRPVQAIAPPSPFALPLVDLAGLPPGEGESELLRVAQREIRRPSDPETGPLLRVYLLRLEPAAHALLVGLHHIVTDAWSEGILIRELSLLYNAFRAGERSPLPDLPIQYADFAAWHRSWLEGPEIQAQLAWWTERLADAPRLLALATDRPRPAVRSWRGVSQTFELAADTAPLHALAGREGATLFMLLLAAVQAVLGRWSRQTDVVIGSPIANRTRAELESLAGFFVNTLALRTDLSGDPTFRELLGRARETALGAYAHQDLPFERLVDELRLERSLSHSPLFQVLLALENEPPPELRLSGLHVRPLDLDMGMARFELTLTVVEERGRLAATLEHSTDLFEAPTVSRLEGHLCRFLAAVAAAPEQRISAVEILAAPERQQILLEWNDSAAAEGTATAGLCLHELVEAQARRSPAAPAVVFAGDRLTYAELDARANRLAHRLRALGCGPESRVAVALERSPDLPVALLAALKAGGAYVPLDPDYPAGRLAFMLADARPAVLVTTERLRALLPVPADLPTVCIDAERALLERESAASPAVPGDDRRLAYVIYTSGSTGRPKGAMVHHRGIRNRLLWMQEAYRLTAADTVLQKTPFSFDVSVWELFWPLLAGARLVLARPGAHREASELVELIEGEAVSVLHFVPSMLQVFLGEPAVAQGAACRTLRLIVASGEALPIELAQRCCALLPGAELHNLYGPTEASVDVTSWHCRPGDPAAPIGRPMANTRIHLLDPALRPVPLGVAGELVIGGVHVGRGYLARPDLTAERFVPDPLSPRPGERLYRTGDLARHLPGGAVEYLGRIDHQVKIRGFRIELGEIEAALLARPEVQEAIVVAADARLAAYLVPAPSHEIAVAELRGALARTLPEHMMPAVWMVLPALPLSPNGKVDREALPAPEAPAGGGFAAARTPLERLLAHSCAQVLGLERAGLNDSFFALGGDSIRGAIFINQLQERLGLRLPLVALFRFPVLADLAAHLAASHPGLAAGDCAPGTAEAGWTIPRLPRGAGEDLPLSFAQQRLWFVDRANPGLGIYNSPVVVRLAGDLDPAAMARALAAVTRRHEVLRATFHEVGGVPVQRITAPAPFPLPVADLSAVPAAVREATASRLAAAESERPFELSRGPLLRGLLLRLEEREHVLILNLHHIVSDGWTAGVLIREVAELYRAAREGRRAVLPDLPIQYTDFAAWQRGWLQGEVLERDLEYWRRQLQGEPPLLELPADRPRPARPSHRGARLVRLLPAPLAGELRALSRQRGTTLFMTLLAGLAALLFRKTRQSDVVLGSAVAGRGRPETEPLMGTFVNMLALRTDLSGNPTFLDLMERVRRTVVGAFDHQDLPFDKLVEHLRRGRSAEQSPLFRIAFGLDNIPGREVRLPGLTLLEMELEREVVRFDLTLWILEEGERLTASWLYSSDLFEAATIGRLHEQWVALLQSAAADPAAPLARLGLRAEPALVDHAAIRGKRLRGARRGRPGAGAGEVI